eukprot:TRINITY_DN5078_c0_g1_i1.p1 TRINITY_DN5078_c0_g1~~TRINITY_DN5078_c0_g1_i1.p1  ORF type:complete len:233 (+),score=66.31 TRINITY_DN5078_c0_g1_i1:41-739(+)
MNEEQLEDEFSEVAIDLIATPISKCILKGKKLTRDELYLKVIPSVLGGIFWVSILGLYASWRIYAYKKTEFKSRVSNIRLIFYSLGLLFFIVNKISGSLISQDSFFFGYVLPCIISADDLWNGGVISSILIVLFKGIFVAAPIIAYSLVGFRVPTIIISDFAKIAITQNRQILKGVILEAVNYIVIFLCVYFFGGRWISHSIVMATMAFAFLALSLIRKFLYSMRTANKKAN